MADYKGEYKNNKTKWIVIYLVAAVVIYGVIYALVIKKKSGGSSAPAKSLYNY